MIVTTGAEVEEVVNGFTVQNTGTTAPTIISVTPPSSAVGVPLNTAVTLQWSEPMNRTTFTAATFYLYDSVTGLNIPATIGVDASGRIVTLTPTQLLAVDRAYYIYIGYAAGIKDALGNAFGNAFYAFTTGFSTDNTGPQFITSNIPAGATGVPLNAPVVLQFSSPINPTTQTAGVQITTGGNPVNGTYAFNAAQTVLTFTPTPILTAGTTYTVAYTAQLTDDAGNGLTNPGNFTFTTGAASDTTGPAISSTDPPANATGVGTNATLRVVFTKPVDPTTIVPGTNLFLYNANDNNISYPGIITFSADRTSLTFTLASPLPNLTQFYWQLYTYKGENGVADVQNIFQYFTTGSAADTTAPSVTSISPINGAANVPVNTKISALFSDTIDATSVTNSSISLSPSAAGTATLSADQLSLTFTPTANLSISTVYTISIGGLRDIEGNALTPFTPTTFTTSASAVPDTTHPTVTFAPAQGATNVALNSTVTLNVNEPINAATVRTDTTNSTDTFAVLMTPAGGSQVQVGGSFTVTNTNTSSQIVFTPASPFEPNSSVIVYGYYNAYMTDYAGNTVTAATATFTTTAGTDTTPPVVTSVTPPQGATAVGQNTPVILTFSKPLNPATVNATNFHLFNGSTAIATGVTRSSDDRTITLTATLPSGALINVVVTTGVTDLVGNALATAFNSSFTAETTPPATRPSVVTMRPGSGATGVPVNSPITLILSEPMNPATISGALNVAQNGVLVAGTTQLDATGQTIVFTPSGPFANGALVQVFLSTAATDTFGNPLNNFTGQFTVAANLAGVAPTVVSVNPTNESTINVLNPVILVQFTKPINLATVTSSTFYVKQSDSVVINGTLSLFDPYTIQFVPNPTTLSAGPYYRINMTNGIQDTSGIAFAGSVTGNYYFYINGTATLVDTVSPVVTGLAPTDGSTVGDNTIFRATFSKPIDPLTVNANTFKISGGGVTVMPSSITFDATNQNVTITPQTPLPDNASMTISISGIEDPQGNLVTPLTANFTTLNGSDLTQPVVISTNITTNEVNVPINSPVIYQFSKPMDSRTLNAANFYIYDTVTGIHIPATLSVSGNGLTLTMTPTSPLPVGRLFYLYGNTAQDLAGNVMVSYFITFTTAFAPNSVPPVVSDTSPRNGATGVPTNAPIQVLFSESVQPGTLGGVQLLQGGSPQPATATLSGSDNLVTLTPATLLTANTLYTISVTGVADTDGDVMAGTVTKTFTTGGSIDLTAPTITSYSPTSSETNVPTNAVIHVFFSKPIDQLSLTNANFELYNYAQARYLPATVTVNPSLLEATLVPVSPLLPGNQYFFYIFSFTDLAGNIGGGAEIVFTTGAGTQHQFADGYERQPG